VTTASRAERHRGVLLALAGVRAVLAVLAIPLAPVLYDDHFVLLVLLRPTKDVLLVGGFLVRDGRVGVVPIVLAAVPLALVGVWHFYAIGLAYARELRAGEGMPRWATRIVSPERVKAMEKLIHDNLPMAVLVGRVSVFPSTVLGTAAGVARVPASRFLPLDALGTGISVAEVLLAGYAFGRAYETGGKVVTVIGVVLLVAGLVALGRWLQHHGDVSAGAERGQKSADSA
jgi:membrane protein DedA with SNARE-associated domain